LSLVLRKGKVDIERTNSLLRGNDLVDQLPTNDAHRSLPTNSTDGNDADAMSIVRTPITPDELQRHVRVSRSSRSHRKQRRGPTNFIVV
jgi:hypothetical protein